MSSRRSVLKFALTTFLTRLAKETKAQALLDRKVIVVGAGIAGLAAAKFLQSKGAEVLVLEANSYVGGRIRTDHSMGAPVEFGAGWIHGPSSRNPIKKIADQLQADVFVTDDENVTLFNSDGRAFNSEDYEKFDYFYERIELLVSSFYAENNTLSLYELFEQRAPDILEDDVGHWLLTAYIEFDFATGIQNISAKYAFSDLNFPGADAIFTTGYDVVLEPLKKNLDIRLKHSVTKIKYDASGVNVSTAQNEFFSDYVVCAVPLGVLKASAISFEPSLPASIESAIENIGFGTITKIALKFDEAFWDVDTQYFGIVSDPSGRWNYWLNYRTFSSENILMGFSLGNYAYLTDSMSAHEVEQDALSVLRSVWGDRVTNPVAVLRTQWSENKNFKGTYSYPKVSVTASDYDSFSNDVEGRVLFAGEHTLFDYYSSTHGALLSGERAAKRILEL